MGQGCNGKGGQWDRGAMGRGTLGWGNSGTGAQWDTGTMGQGRNGTGEQWDGGMQEQPLNDCSNFRGRALLNCAVINTRLPSFIASGQILREKANDRWRE